MDPRVRVHATSQMHLAMTVALRQAVEILQMPQVELAQWLQQEIEKNPLLQECSSSTAVSPLEEIPSPLSLYDHLLYQIRETFPLPQDRAIAHKLLEQLDEKGFVSTPIEELGLSPVEAAPILTKLQSFDPPGVFARNLQESLLLQLKARGEGDSPHFLLVRDCFEELLHGRYRAIRKKLGSIDLKVAVQKLTRLSLCPTERFKREAVPLAVADLRFTQTEGGWTVETCEEELPKFRWNGEYEHLTPQSHEEKEVLRVWSTAAKWLLRSLKRRRQILIQVGAWLVRKQASFLALRGALCPVTLQDLASALQLHISTLSRALSGKYAATPRGLIPLRSLVTSCPAKEILMQCIVRENKEHPLTDDQLAKQLQAKGYKMARRTIAKYRKRLKMGTASTRHISH